MFSPLIAIFLCATLLIAQSSEQPSQPSIRQMIEQADELQRAGDFVAAEAVLTSAVARSQQETAGRENLAVALGNLGSLYLSWGQYPASERCVRRALSVATDETVKLRLIGNLAALLIESGQHARAERLNLPELIRTAPPLLRPGLRANWAALLMARGKETEAENLLEQVLAEHRAAKDSVSQAITLNNLGLLALRRKQTNLAIDRLRESLSIWEGRTGLQHPEVLRTLANLGDAYLIAGQKQEAVDALARAAKLTEQYCGEAHPWTAVVLDSYAAALRAAGQSAEAKQVRKRSAAALASLARRTRTEPVDIRDLTNSLRDRRKP